MPELMLEEFKKHMVSCGLQADRKYLVAVSGGIDSIVMAHLFKLAGIHFAIAHCNFQLRGEESDADELFTSHFAAELNVTIYKTRFNTAVYAESARISIQMAARDLRYRWFDEIANTYGFDYIAIGHNKNDSVETMLLNLSRGTGIRGLMGIRTVNNKIVRPVLFASRQKILQYADNNKLHWREDSSNLETKYRRNKIRHTIIPAFESFNPSFTENVLDTIKRIEESGKLLDYILNQIKKEIWTETDDRILMDTKKIRTYPSVKLILFELLRPFGVEQLSEEMLARFLDSTTGKQLHTHSHTLTHDRDYLIITPNSQEYPDETIIDSDTILINYPIRLFFRIIEKSESFTLPAEKNIAALDADKIAFPLKLRKWKSGDRFYPLGLNGSKKISDFLINIKLPLPDKTHVRILESAGEIVWVVNHRIDDRFKVTGSTNKILLIDFGE